MKIRLLDVVLMGLEDYYARGDEVYVSQVAPRQWQFDDAPEFGIIDAWEGQGWERIPDEAE